MPLHSNSGMTGSGCGAFFTSILNNTPSAISRGRGEVTAFSAEAKSYKQVNIFQTFLHLISADKCVSVQGSSRSARINIARIT